MKYLQKRKLRKFLIRFKNTSVLKILKLKTTEIKEEWCRLSV